LNIIKVIYRYSNGFNNINSNILRSVSNN